MDKFIKNKYYIIYYIIFTLFLGAYYKVSTGTKTKQDTLDLVSSPFHFWECPLRDKIVANFSRNHEWIQLIKEESSNFQSLSLPVLHYWKGTLVMENSGRQRC